MGQEAGSLQIPKTGWGSQLGAGREAERQSSTAGGESWLTLINSSPRGQCADSWQLQFCSKVRLSTASCFQSSWGLALLQRLFFQRLGDLASRGSHEAFLGLISLFSSFLITPSLNIRCNLSCSSEPKEPNENTPHGRRWLFFSPLELFSYL